MVIAFGNIVPEAQTRGYLPLLGVDRIWGKGLGELIERPLCFDPTGACRGLTMGKLHLCFKDHGTWETSMKCKEGGRAVSCRKLSLVLRPIFEFLKLAVRYLLVDLRVSENS